MKVNEIEVNSLRNLIMGIRNQVNELDNYLNALEKIDNEKMTETIIGIGKEISLCDNCGYKSIIAKIPTAICPNCNKNKLKLTDEEKNYLKENVRF